MCYSDVYLTDGEDLCKHLRSIGPRRLPSSADPYRRGLVEVFHETFHASRRFGAILRYYVTFVSVDSEVRVDRSFGRNLPPAGC